MNLELNVVRLANEDVITTSAVACKDAFGVIRIDGETSFYAYTNDFIEDVSGDYYYYGQGKHLKNYDSSMSGYYHFTIEGDEITVCEKCPSDTNCYKSDNHNIYQKPSV